MQVQPDFFMPRRYQKIVSPTGWISVKRAAEKLCVSPSSVRRMIADGRLRGRREGARLLFVDPDSIAELVAGQERVQ